MADITKVKVHRSRIRLFPFDLFYLIPNNQREVLPRLFPSSLCFPMSPAMISLLTHVRSVHVDEIYPHMGRRQTTKYKIGPIGLAHLDAVNYDDCFLVVPIFGQIKDPSKTRHPAYITAQRHVHTSDSKFNHIFTDEVVLFTPRGALRPVCLGCPRHILHVQGKCEIGGQFCYDSLSLTLEKEEDEQLSSNDSQLDTLSA